MFCGVLCRFTCLMGGKLGRSPDVVSNLDGYLLDAGVTTEEGYCFVVWGTVGL